MIKNAADGIPNLKKKKSEKVRLDISFELSAL